MKQLGKIYFVQNEPNFSALKILENVSKNSVLWIRIPHLRKCVQKFSVVDTDPSLKKMCPKIQCCGYGSLT